jgi:hypothetical protein
MTELREWSVEAGKSVAPTAASLTDEQINRLVHTIR